MLKPVHIKAPEGSIADMVIVVGDPDRAKLISEMLEDAKLVNEHRGFLVYTGKWKDVRVSIAVHGIGGPSAAIVFEELRMYGARTIVRLGSAGSLKHEVKIGDVVVVSGATYYCGGAGLSGYMQHGCLASSPHPLLTSVIYDELLKAGIKPHLGPVVTSDSFYAEEENFARFWAERGAIAVEMECATLFSLAWMRGYAAAAVLVISDSLVESKEVFLTTQELADRYKVVGRALLDALSRWSREFKGKLTS
jgi:5'-methylthioadenosine phosphorylase